MHKHKQWGAETWYSESGGRVAVNTDMENELRAIHNSVCCLLSVSCVIHHFRSRENVWAMHLMITLCKMNKLSSLETSGFEPNKNVIIIGKTQWLQLSNKNVRFKRYHKIYCIILEIFQDNLLPSDHNSTAQSVWLVTTRPFVLCAVQADCTAILISGSI